MKVRQNHGAAIASAGMIGGLAVVFGATMLVAGCGGGGGTGGDRTAPAVSSVTPGNNATGVAITSSVAVGFDEAIDCAALGAGILGVTDPRAGAVDGRLRCDVDTITFTPDHGFSKDATITARLSGEVRDLAGNVFRAGMQWSFATARRAWGGAEFIHNRPGGDAGNGRIAFDAEGNAMAVWNQSDGTRSNIWARRYTAASGWETPTLVESQDGDARMPHIAFDAGGNAVAVWRQHDGTRLSIWANRFTAGAGWGQETSIAGAEAGDAQSPDVAVDPQGNAVAVWDSGDSFNHRIWSNRYAANSGWGTPEPIDLGNSHSARIGMDAHGNAIAVWLKPNAIWTNRYTVGEGWGEATAFVTAGTPVGGGALAVAANGTAVTTWFEQSGTSHSVVAARYVPADGWDQPVPVVTHTDTVAAPRCAIGPDGTLFAIWHQYEEGRARIRASRRTAATGWEPPELIDDTAAGHAFEPVLAVDAAGNLLAAWIQGDESYSIWSSRRLRGSSWSAPLAIEGQVAGYPTELELGLDAGGDGFAVWTHIDDADGVAASRFQ